MLARFYWPPFALIVCLSAQHAFALLDCGPGKYRVAAHHRSAYYEGDGTFVNESDVKEHCRARSAAYDFWNPKLKSGRPESWGLTNEKNAEWSTAERERVLKILEGLPLLFRQLSPTGIYRLREAREPKNPGLTTLGRIVLYDVAFAKDYRLALVLTHELAHRLFEELSPEEQNSFRSAAGWRVRVSKNQASFVPSRPKSQYVRPNGMLSPMEDFSDDIAAYLHDPRTLKKVAPRVYDWIMRNLGDKLKDGRPR
jgi:hypothetical protein